MPEASERINIVFTWVQQLLQDRKREGGLPDAASTVWSLLSQGYSQFEHCRWVAQLSAFCPGLICPALLRTALPLMVWHGSAVNGNIAVLTVSGMHAKSTRLLLIALHVAEPPHLVSQPLYTSGAQSCMVPVADIVLPAS